MPAHILLAKEHHIIKNNVSGSMGREVYSSQKDEKEREKERLLAEDNLIYLNHIIIFMESWFLSLND